MTTVAVISGIYGGYDHPAAPPEQDSEADWVMVCDRDYDCKPWQVTAEPRPSCHPRLAAKYAKARPFDYTSADIAIWVDGNMRIGSAGFVSWCLEHLGDADLAMTPHPQTGTITGELGLAQPLAKYDGQPMRAQVDHYLSGGFPEDYGHWWTGLIIRRRSCPDFGDAWLREMFRWGYEDQLSLPVVFAGLGIRPVSLPQGWMPPYSLFGWAAHNAEAEWGTR